MSSALFSGCLQNQIRFLALEIDKNIWELGRARLGSHALMSLFLASNSHSKLQTTHIVKMNYKFDFALFLTIDTTPPILPAVKTKFEANNTPVHSLF
jgi:hypothetical protein